MTGGVLSVIGGLAVLSLAFGWVLWRERRDGVAARAPLIALSLLALLALGAYAAFRWLSEHATTILY